MADGRDDRWSDIDMAFGVVRASELAHVSLRPGSTEVRSMLRIRESADIA